MRRRTVAGMAGAGLVLAAMALAASDAPAQAAPADLAALFGPAIAAHPLAATPFAELDLDGDGKPDRVWVVRVSRGGAEALAKDTRRANPFGKRGLARGGEPLALAIAHATGERWLVHDGEFFATPIWSARPLPLEPARRGAKRHREAVAAGARPRGDLLLLGTEAGIDVALFWNGRGYVVNAPKEEP